MSDRPIFMGPGDHDLELKRIVVTTMPKNTDIVVGVDGIIILSSVPTSVGEQVSYMLLLRLPSYSLPQLQQLSAAFPEGADTEREVIRAAARRANRVWEGFLDEERTGELATNVRVHAHVFEKTTRTGKTFRVVEWSRFGTVGVVSTETTPLSPQETPQEDQFKLPVIEIDLD